MKKKLTPAEQATVDFFYLYELEACIKSLDDVFELAMDNDYQPTGYDFQIHRFLKDLLYKIKPPKKPKREQTTYWKREHAKYNKKKKAWK